MQHMEEAVQDHPHGVITLVIWRYSPMNTGAARLILLLHSAAAVALAGCGGSLTGNGPSGGGGPAGGSGGPADSRSALFATITAKFDTFDGTSPDQENQQILAFLKAKPEFVESGISDVGGAWGRFADGSTLVIANNLDRKQPFPPRLKRSAAVKRSRSREGGLPTTENVVIGTSLGQFFETANTEIANMFLEQPYSLASPAETVDALKTMSNVGVLYLTAHGCSAPIRIGGPQTFLVWTSSLRTPALDETYKADLQDGSLSYFAALTFQGDETVLRWHTEVHYAITSKFVTKYWKGKFNKNSIVFMNACSSAATVALDFENACLQAGASVYLGWTNTMVIRDGVITAAYLFDRMLGANTFFDVEKPPQRPFDINSVLAEMGARNRTYTATSYDSTLNPKTGITAKLDMLANNGNFGLLAPSIVGLRVNEQKGELTVFGTFGEPKGDVTINDAAMTVKNWTATEVTCALDREGPNASGDVMVAAGLPRQRSNPVQLTEWIVGPRRSRIPAWERRKACLPFTWSSGVTCTPSGSIRTQTRLRSSPNANFRSRQPRLMRLRDRGTVLTG